MLQGIRINAVCPESTNTPMVAQALANELETMRAVMKEIPIGDLVTLRKSPPSFFGRAVPAQGS